jgi:hypothetical protein
VLQGAAARTPAEEEEEAAWIYGRLFDAGEKPGEAEGGAEGGAEGAIEKRIGAIKAVLAMVVDGEPAPVKGGEADGAPGRRHLELAFIEHFRQEQWMGTAAPAEEFRKSVDIPDPNPQQYGVTLNWEQREDEEGKLAWVPVQAGTVNIAEANQLVAADGVRQAADKRAYERKEVRPARSSRT